MANQMPPQFTAQQQQQQQPFMDTTNTKIFVGGLAWETKSDMLRRYFEPFGEILEAVVISDKHTARSKGYGFVTFRDPEAAKRACANPNPVIDGRRANCNLASLGRPVLRVLPQPQGSMRSPSPYFRGPQTPRGMYVGSPVHPLPANYGYQPGMQISPYRYPAYGPEYFYPQMYGVPGTVGPNTVVCGQMGHLPPTNHPGYTPIRGQMMPNYHALQYGRPGMNPGNMSSIQTPNHPGIRLPSPVTPQIIIPTSPPQFTQSSGSDQMAG